LYEDKYYGRDLKPGREFQETLRKVLYDGVNNNSVLAHIPIILEKLGQLETIIKDLRGFRFYGSSLLLIYDALESRRGEPSSTDSDTEVPKPKPSSTTPPAVSHIDIKIVDFANCLTSTHNLPPSTPFPPRNRYGIDRGYLRGLRSLRTYFQRIWKDIYHEEWVDRGEGEGLSRTEDNGGRRNGMPTVDIAMADQDDSDGEVSI
jgi:inositol-hexakisphosphate kinase